MGSEMCIRDRGRYRSSLSGSRRAAGTAGADARLALGVLARAIIGDRAGHTVPSPVAVAPAVLIAGGSCGKWRVSWHTARANRFGTLITVVHWSIVVVVGPRCAARAVADDLLAIADYLVRCWCTGGDERGAADPGDTGLLDAVDVFTRTFFRGSAGCALPDPVTAGRAGTVAAFAVGARRTVAFRFRLAGPTGTHTSHAGGVERGAVGVATTGVRRDAGLAAGFGAAGARAERASARARLTGQSGCTVGNRPAGLPRTAQRRGKP